MLDSSRGMCDVITWYYISADQDVIVSHAVSHAWSITRSASKEKAKRKDQKAFVWDFGSKQIHKVVFIMPPILKIIFIIMGIAPLLRLILTTVVVSCGTAAVLWSSIACGLMERSSACLGAIVAYSTFSLLSLAFSRKRTAERQGKNVQWKLVWNSAVRLVGIINY